MKPQFTEEESHDFCVDMQFSNVLTVKQIMREKGYIRKSDLEILIEEAEEMYKKWNHENCELHKQWSWDSMARLICRLYDAFQAMKSELNKRREG